MGNEIHLFLLPQTAGPASLAAAIRIGAWGSATATGLEVVQSVLAAKRMSDDSFSSLVGAHTDAFIGGDSHLQAEYRRAIEGYILSNPNKFEAILPRLNPGMVGAVPAGMPVDTTFGEIIINASRKTAVFQTAHAASNIIIKDNRKSGQNETPQFAAKNADPDSPLEVSKEYESALDVEGLYFKNDSLYFEDKMVERLGVGGQGVVDVHPRVPGAVIKTVKIGAFNLLAGASGSDEGVVEKEERATVALAMAGVGPRYFGRVEIPRRLNALDRIFGEAGASKRIGSVRERIFGMTVQDLIYLSAYKNEEHALVLDLIDRFAWARMKVDDFHPRNIMIGRTRMDKRCRAYLVDGGNLLEVDPCISREELRERILKSVVVIESYLVEGVGVVSTFEVLKKILEDGLARSTRETLWQHIKDKIGR